MTSPILSHCFGQANRVGMVRSDLVEPVGGCKCPTRSIGITATGLPLCGSQFALHTARRMMDDITTNFHDYNGVRTN